MPQPIEEKGIMMLHPRPLRPDRSPVIARLLIAALLVGVAVQPALAGGLWEGPYIGLNAGYESGLNKIGVATGDGPWTSSPANLAGQTLTNLNGPDELDYGGVLGGLQVGYNFQSGHIVYGLEADADHFGATKQTTRGPFLNSLTGHSVLFQESIQPDWLITLRPRLGYADRRVFSFVTGGLAVGHQIFSDSRPLTTGVPGYPAELGKMQIGWSLGAGIEWALSRSLSFRADYLHAEFGRAKTTGFGGTNNAFGIDYNSALSSNVIRAGMDFHFGTPAKKAGNAELEADDAPSDWSGMYAGLNAGFHRASHQFSSEFGKSNLGPPAADLANINKYGSNKLSSDNGGGGVQIGFLKQIGPVPVGIEADLDYVGDKIANSDQSFALTGGGRWTYNETVRTNWLATVRPRAGWRFGPVFPYVTGGLGLANLQWSDKVGFSVGNSFGYPVAKTETVVGWVGGGGVECDLGGPWSLKAEYLRAKFDSSHQFGTRANNAFSIDYASDLAMNIARIGVNYHF
jgi:outer membrane immunogenic protein